MNARDAELNPHAETFLVAGVATILLVRLYLQLTGFPKIGGNSGLHVAHTLFGGVLMTVVIVLLLGFLGRQVKVLASLVGGIGFGLFIDELGKFITSDYNYFFQPTIALIYVLFIVVYLSTHAILSRQLPRSAQLANAASVVENGLVSGASRRQIIRGLRFLEASGTEGPLVDSLRQALSVIADESKHVHSPLTKLGAYAWRLYDRLVAWPAFGTLAGTIFVLRGVAGVGFALGVGVAELQGVPVQGSTLDMDRPMATLGIAAQLLTLALIVLGVVVFGRSRLAAYHWFERGILVSVFVGQFCLFWLAELAATGLLLVDLVLLGIVRYLIHQQAGRNELAEVHDLRNRAIIGELFQGDRHGAANVAG